VGVAKENTSFGVMTRDSKGRFVKGVPSKGGRPRGSKNAITLQKLLIEEAFRDATGDDVAKVLRLIVKQALEGDKVSQKLVWESNVSKHQITEDKAHGAKQEIKVHTMNVSTDKGVNLIEGEFVDETKETLQ
jgi:hypothetical protein